MTCRASSRARAVVVALALTSVVASPAFAADPKKDAQTLFEMAVKQADSGDNAAALSSFRAAYEKYPNYKVLYNIGKVCARMGDAACAVRNYEQYLREGDKDVPKARRKEVEDQVKSLSRTLAMVSVRSNLTGADVVADDQVIGKIPLAAPVPLRGGEHKIAVVHEGQKLERTVTLVAGESATLVLDSDKTSTGAPAAAPKDEPKKEPKKDGAKEKEKDDAPLEPAEPVAPRRESEEPRAFPVVPWAITGALAGATILTGVLTAGAYGTYQDKKEEFPVSRDDLDSSQSTARDLFVLTSVLGACTLVSAGIATYFTFFSSPSGSNNGPPPSKARIGVAIGPRGIAVEGLLP